METMGERSGMAQVVSPFCCCASRLWFFFFPPAATFVIQVICIHVGFLFSCAELVGIS